MGSDLLKKKKRKALRNIASEKSASIARSIKELLGFMETNASCFVVDDDSAIIYEDEMQAHIALYLKLSRSLKEKKK